MTSLVCWVGRDHRKVNSMYIASDSRVTVGDVVLSDGAQKVFACRVVPEVYGYCGNAERPPEVLRTLVTALDDGNAWSAYCVEHEQAEWVRRFLSESLPVGVGGPDYSGTVVVRGTRSGEGFAEAEFSAVKFFVGAGGWDWVPLHLPDASDVVVAEGSGAERVRAWRDYWTSAQGKVRTSRGVFSALCGALRANEDVKSGGAPQLVGMYQEGPPKTFGVLYEDARFVSGRMVPATEAGLWRDELFQVCDGETMRPASGAQLHRRHRGL